MKQYQKAQMIAKNLPSGSYAAGCPAKDKGPDYAWVKTGCTICERTK